jgi:hypothetical protein
VQHIDFCNLKLNQDLTFNSGCPLLTGSWRIFME